jgi:hypothetical protein
MRQVTETIEQERRYTVMRPVTRYETRYVDQGCYVDQVVQLPPSAPIRRGLTWMPAAPVLNPVSGQLEYQRPGFVWATVQPPPQQVVQKVWKPNLVAVQAPVTEYCPQQVVEKVPVQVCRQVPEQMTRKVPVQVCRLVTEEHVRKVPYTVCRQVVERVEHKVPVKVCRIVTEEHVRQVPVTVCRYVQEERVEPYQVRVCRMVEKQQTINVPRTVCRKEPVTYTYRVPRTILMKVPVAQPCCDVTS